MEPANNPARPVPPAGLTARQAAEGFGAWCLDEAACRAWLLTKTHPAGPACPGCGSKPAAGPQARAWHAGRRLHCPACGRWYSATSGTVLENSKIGPRQIMLIAVCVGLGMDNATTARLAGVSQETVRQWRGRLE